MHKLLDRYLGSGSIAFLASGIGPKIMFAPPGDGDGGAGDGKGDGDGNGDDDDGKPDDKGDGDGDGKGDDDGNKSALAGKLKGTLLGTRKPKEGEADPNAPPPQPGKDGRPAHVPEKFWDPKTKTVKHDDMAKAYLAIEKAHGELKRSKGIGADVPDDEAGYFGDEGLKLEDAKNFGEEVPADDPGLKTWAKVAKKWGVGKDAAIGMAKDMFKGMNEHAPAPIDIEAEREALGAGGDELVDGVFLWLEGQEQAGKFGAEDIDVAVDLANTAAGIRFLAKMRAMSGEAPIPLGLPQGHKGMSADEWHAEMRDAVRAKDYKRQAELDAISGSIFGTEAASGSPVMGVPLQRDIARGARK